MDAIRKIALAEEGRLVLEDPAFHGGESFEVLVQPTHDLKRPMTAQDLLKSGLVGIWADRDDIGDSVEFARELRRRIEENLRGR